MNELINKNDCFDCANCVPKDLLNKNTEWVCKVVDKPITEIFIEEECPNFEYED